MFSLITARNNYYDEDVNYTGLNYPNRRLPSLTLMIPIAQLSLLSFVVLKSDPTRERFEFHLKTKKKRMKKVRLKKGHGHYITEFPSTTLHKLAFPLPHYLFSPRNLYRCLSPLPLYLFKDFSPFAHLTKDLQNFLNSCPPQRRKN